MQETGMKQSGTGRKCNDSLEDIAAVICVFSVVIVGNFAIFAKDQMMICAYIVGALAAMGVCFGWLSTHSGQAMADVAKQYRSHAEDKDSGALQ